MATLKLLEQVCGVLFGQTQAQAHVLAMLLRKNGLLSTAGRGLNAAKMGPSDATSMVLAMLANRMPTKCAETVRTLRACPMTIVEHWEDGAFTEVWAAQSAEDRCPPDLLHPWLKEGFLLGFALDAVLDGLTKEQVGGLTAPHLSIIRANGHEHGVLDFHLDTPRRRFTFTRSHFASVMIQESRTARAHILVVLATLIADAQLPGRDPEVAVKILNDLLNVAQLAPDVSLPLEYPLSHKEIFGAQKGGSFDSIPQG